MTQIIKDKAGKELSRTDTGYHRDGTGARDPQGNLISNAAAKKKPAGISAELASKLKTSITGGPSTNDAPNGASAAQES